MITDYWSTSAQFWGKMENMILSDPSFLTF